MAFEQTKQKAKSFFKKALWILLIGLLLTGVSYYFYRTYTYSEGVQIGVLFKISKKGNIFKTYEGQLQLAGATMMSKQSVFYFSAKDEATYLALQNLEGKTVKLYYNQLNDAFIWQGDTDYLVYKAEEVKE